jgi:hypothetical protein
MFSFSRRLICLLLLVGYLTLTVVAAPGPSPNLDKLTQASDLILLGELLSVERGVGTTTVEVNGKRINCRIDRGKFRVDQVVKGEHTTGILRDDFIVPLQRLGWKTPRQATYGLYFFRVKDDKTLEFSDQYHTYIPTLRRALAQGSSPLERIVKVLGDVLATPNTDHDLGIEALEYLETSKSPAANIALRGALRNADPEIRLTAASALIRQGDSSGLDVIKKTKK